MIGITAYRKALSIHTDIVLCRVEAYKHAYVSNYSVTLVTQI